MKYVALLRGINVGGNNKVDMSELKDCFEKLGFNNVLTYINTGNVVFETTQKDIIDSIENGIEKRFGFRINVVTRTKDDIQQICHKVPKEWQNNKEQKTDVMFLWDEYDTMETIKLIEINPEVDTLKYIQGAIIWNIERKKYSKSKLNKLIGTKIYKNMTARNINTVRKICDLMD